MKKIFILLLMLLLLTGCFGKKEEEKKEDPIDEEEVIVIEDEFLKQTLENMEEVTGLIVNSTAQYKIGNRIMNETTTTHYDYENNTWLKMYNQSDFSYNHKDETIPRVQANPVFEKYNYEEEIVEKSISIKQESIFSKETFEELEQKGGNVDFMKKNMLFEDIKLIANIMEKNDNVYTAEFSVGENAKYEKLYSDMIKISGEHSFDTINIAIQIEDDMIVKKVIVYKKLESVISQVIEEYSDFNQVYIGFPRPSDEY